MSQARVGVSIIVLNEKNEILIGVRKGSHGSGLYSLPGGHLEYLEKMETTCSRELDEEIGCHFNNYEKVGFSEEVFNGEKHYITLYFKANCPNDKLDEIRTMEPDKCEGWEWRAYKDLPEIMFCDSLNQINNCLCSVIW